MLGFRGLGCWGLALGVAVNGVSTIVSKLSEKTAANMEQLAQVTKFEKFEGP